MWSSIPSTPTCGVVLAALSVRSRVEVVDGGDADDTTGPRDRVDQSITQVPGVVHHSSNVGVRAHDQHTRPHGDDVDAALLAGVPADVDDDAELVHGLDDGAPRPGEGGRRIEIPAPEDVGEVAVDAAYPKPELVVGAQVRPPAPTPALAIATTRIATRPPRLRISPIVNRLRCRAPNSSRATRANSSARPLPASERSRWVGSSSSR